MYLYRPPRQDTGANGDDGGIAIELKLVNRVRAKLDEWRPSRCAERVE